MRNYYKKLKDAILIDVTSKLGNTLEEKTAERIKKDLDIAADCQKLVDSMDEELANEFDQLSEEAQQEIDKIIKRELHGEEE